MCRFQKFEAVTVNRGQLKNAPYNPRTIGEHARAKLKAQMKAQGLVSTLVWNKRTGNLVGGHQRISILDDLERSQNYLLTVSAIDVDETTEKQLNLFLNNQNVQGDWDIAGLEKIMKDLDGKVEGTGFDKIELQALCNSAEMAGIFSDEADKAAPVVNSIQSLKDRRKVAREKNQKQDDVDFYAVLVFGDAKELDGFLARCQLVKSERYHDGRKVMAMLKGGRS